MLIPQILVVVLIWLPFGFGLHGLVEEWDILGRFSQNGVFFWSGIQSSMAAHALRPLTILPHAIAYILDPNSFFYWNLILMLSLIVKGFSCALLVRRATGSSSWGSIAGLLMVLYPADTMQLCFRSIHINCAIALLLVSSLTLMIAWDKHGKPISFVYALFSTGTFLTSVLMYETGVVFLVLPLLTLMIRDGYGAILGGIKKRMSLLSVWSTGVMGYLSYVVFAAPKIHSYQQDVAAVPFSTLMHSIPQLLQILLFRLPLGGWIDAAGIVLQEYKNYAYLLFSGVFLFGIVVIISIQQISLNGSEFREVGLKCRTSLIAMRMIGVGAFCGILGCIPYLINPVFFNSAQRVYLYAAYGAALFWCGVLMFIWQRTRIASGVIIGIMILLGMGAQLYQLHHFIGISERQRILLKSAVEHFSGNPSHKTLLICDHTNQIGQLWVFIPNTAFLMFSYLYGKPVDSVEYCHFPSMTWKCINAQNLTGLVVESPSEWKFIPPEDFKGPGYVPKPALKEHILPKSEVISIVTDIVPTLSSNEDSEKNQKALLEGKSGISMRYRGFLLPHRWPFSIKMFRDDFLGSDFRFNMVTWWGYDNSLCGTGWRGSDLIWGGWWKKNHPWCWKNQKSSSIDFIIKPIDGSYNVLGSCNAFANDRIRQGLKISINEYPVVCQWTSGGRFSANIDSKILKNGKNTITFDSDIDRDYFGLSFSLESLEIKPSIKAKHPIAESTVSAR